jgi:hypothetical protein
MTRENSQPRRRTFFSGYAVWALVTGLAIGFVIGQESREWGVDRRAPQKSVEDVTDVTAETTATEPLGPPPPPIATEAKNTKVTKVTAAEAPKEEAAAAEKKVATAPSTSLSTAPLSFGDFPAGWLKDSDLPKRLFVGLTERQKATALQVMNQRNCECGCSLGSLANCLKKDPNCPRSPTLTGVILGMVQQDRPLADIFAAVDRGQREMNLARAEKVKRKKAQSSGRRKVEIAAWNPRKGPVNAKVTIVEFSDFQ